MFPISTKLKRGPESALANMHIHVARLPANLNSKLRVQLGYFTYFNEGIRVFETGTQLGFFIVAVVCITVFTATFG